MDNFVLSGMQSEYQGKYQKLCIREQLTDFHAEPYLGFPESLSGPNGLQSQSAPGMYYTEYSHTGTGWPVDAVVKTIKSRFKKQS